jgi:hypothetical protein
MIRYAETPAGLKREAAFEEVAVGTIDDQETTPPETLAKLEGLRQLDYSQVEISCSCQAGGESSCEILRTRTI